MQLNQLAPDFELPDLEGKLHRLTESYIIQRAVIAQDACTIEEEYMWRCDSFIKVCNQVLRIDQDPGNAP